MANIIGIDLAFNEYYIQCSYDPRPYAVQMIEAMSMTDKFQNDMRDLDIEKRKRENEVCQKHLNDKESFLLKLWKKYYSC